MSGKIKVICHGCGARYQVRSNKVRGRRFRATCKKCGGIIVAHCTDAFTVMPGGSSVSNRPASALQLDRDDLDHDEDCSWYAVIAGKPHGPMNHSQIRSSFEQGQITERTYLWRAGDPEWRRLSEVLDFSGWTQDVVRDPRQTTETLASGPQGLRRQAGIGGAEVYDAADDAGYDDPTDERTAFFHDAPPEDEMESEATRFHVKDQPDAVPYAHSPPTPAPPQQEAWQQVPVVPPRKAVLPSPTGTPMRPLLPPPSGPPGQSPPGDHTRPISEDERIGAGLQTGPGGGLPPLGMPPPGQPPSLAAGLPPLPRPTAGTPSGIPALTPSLAPKSLAPVGGQPGQPGHLLAPVAEEEPFWTTGKIAAAAAIGGGLAVALAVVIVVSLVRPKQHTLEELPKTPDIKAAQREIKRTAEEVTSKPQAAPKSTKIAITIKPPPPEPDQPRKAPRAKAGPKQARKAAQGRVKRTSGRRRVSARRRGHRRSSRSRRSRSRIGSDVDTLLAAGSRRRRSKPASSGTADADAILSAGSRSRKKAAAPQPASTDADAILAAGSRPRKKKPRAASTSLDQTQIRAAMRRIKPHVSSCYDKYGQGGLVRVRVTIKSNGKGTGVVIGKLAGTPTGFCVLGGIYKATFPKFSGNPITFVYPFRLQ